MKEETMTEDLWDMICMRCGFDKDGKELQSLIRELIQVRTVIKKKYQDINIWVKYILKEEKLTDWKVVWSKSGGLTQFSTKTIFCLPNDRALLLHEIAHALTQPIEQDKTGHNSIWGDKFTELIRKYLLK